MNLINKITTLLFMVSLITAGYAGSKTVKKDTSIPKKASSTTTDIQKSQPFHIKHADRLRWEKIKGDNVAILTGNVELFLEKDQITICADSVVYHSDPKNYKAMGHVKITKTDPKEGKIISHSQKAIYVPDTEKVTLEGSPKVYRDKDEIVGDVLILTFSDEGAVIEGTNIQGILYPREN